MPLFLVGSPRNAARTRHRDLGTQTISAVAASTTAAGVVNLRSLPWHLCGFPAPFIHPEKGRNSLPLTTSLFLHSPLSRPLLPPAGTLSCLPPLPHARPRPSSTATHLLAPHRRCDRRWSPPWGGLEGPADTRQGGGRRRRMRQTAEAPRSASPSLLARPRSPAREREGRQDRRRRFSWRQDTSPSSQRPQARRKFSRLTGA